LAKHLPPPQAKDINLNLGVQESSGMAEMKEMMAQMARQQKEMIENGTDVKTIAEQGLVLIGTATEKL
jgi:hypothetical protein